MTKSRVTVEQAFCEFEEFMRENFPDGGVFYDGPMDPIYRIAQQYSDELDAEIAAAGGIDAWRASKTLAVPAQPTETTRVAVPCPSPCAARTENTRRY